MTELHKGCQGPESSCKSHPARADAQLGKVARDIVSQGFVGCLAGAEPQHVSSSVTQPGPGSRSQKLRLFVAKLFKGVTPLEKCGRVTSL